MKVRGVQEREADLLAREVDVEPLDHGKTGTVDEAQSDEGDQTKKAHVRGLVRRGRRYGAATVCNGPGLVKASFTCDTPT
jgi:hypothetical protein